MTRQELLDFLVERMGATNNEIAARFNVTPNYAATRTKQLFDAGYTTRTPDGRTITGTQKFMHFAKKTVTSTMPKQDRVKAEQPVRERLEYSGIGDMLQTISDAIAKQITAGVVVILQTSLARELAAVVPQHTVPQAKQLTLNLGNLLPEPPVTKPCIGILGLLPVQEEAINAEFADVFDFRYWKDGGTIELKALARASDLVLVTKWCAHSATETLKRAGCKWRFVSGGLSELKTTITALYVEK
jgi:hypothetical protein